MLKLREPFSQKIHLHIRQNMLQRLWDKYVPQSSAAYGQIQLVYLKDMLGELEEQPKQVKLLLWLLLKNKIMQINLMQYPALVKVGQKQMERRLRQIERYYGAQLKSCDFTMFRTVKQYFALLEQAQENSRRYQGWQNSYREIEKQREESRLLSLFSVKLQELVTKHSERALRTMEQEFISSLSKTEYRTLSEEMIWGEKTELISYLRACDTVQCEKIINVLEREVGDSRTREALEVVFEQPVKEELIAAVERLEQKEFCLLYHQVTELEDVASQMVVWKEKQSEMVQSIDRLETVLLQQMWGQMEALAQPPRQNAVQNVMQSTVEVLGTEALERNIVEVWGKEVLEQNIVEVWGKEVSGADLLRIREKLTQFLRQDTDTLRVQVQGVTEQDITEQRITGQDITEQDITEQYITEQAALRTLERELVYSLSDTQYRTLSEELIWQEKTELIDYLKACSTAQCEELIDILENVQWDIQMGEALQSVFEQHGKEELIAAVEQLEQKEFCLFYHQVEGIEQVSAQMVIWKEDREEMLRTIDQMETELLQRIHHQVETMTNSLEQTMQQTVLRIQEKERICSLLETEYRTFAQELIWKEKPEFIAYLKECSKSRCKEIVKELEKDIQMNAVLSSVQKQSVRKKLVGAGRKLKQDEFIRFYWQIVDMKYVNPPLIVWKKNKSEMLLTIDEMKPERLQEVWAQMEAVPFVKGMKSVFSEKMLQMQSEYRQKEMQSVQEEISTVLEENALERITDIVNIGQLLQDIGKAQEAEGTERAEKGVSSVIRRLEQEQEIRKERVEQQQRQAVTVYQEAYQKIFNTEEFMTWQKENTERLVEQTFLERYHQQEKLTREEMQTIREWSKAFLEIDVTKQEQSESDNAHDMQEGRTQLLRMIEQMNHYIEKEYGSEKILELLTSENAQYLEERYGSEKIVELLTSENAQYMEKQYSSEKIVELLTSENAKYLEEQYGSEKILELLASENSKYIEERYGSEKIVELLTSENAKYLEERYGSEKILELLASRNLQYIKERYGSEKILELLALGNSQYIKEQYGSEKTLELLASEYIHEIENQRGSETNAEPFVSEQLQYIEEQHHFDFNEKLILNWQENLLKDERIQNALVSIQNLEEEQRQKFIQYMADMMIIRQEITLSEHELSSKGTDTTQLSDKAEYEEPFSQNTSYIPDIPSAQDNGYDFEERVLRTGDREFAAKLLQIEDKEFAGRLLNIGNKAFVEALLRIDDRTVIERLLRIDDREAVEQLLQENDIQQLDVPYAKLWEWGETLLFHPDNQPEWEDGDLISMERQETVSFDGAQQEDLQTQVIRQQIAMAKDRNYLQRLIRQINHQTDVELVYTDNQLRLPQVQTLLQYIRELDEKQFGVLVKELAQITKIQKMPYEEVKVSETAQENMENKHSTPEPSETKMFVSERRTIPYPVLVQRIQEYEKQHTLKLYRDIANIEQRVFPQAYEKRRQRSVTYGLLSYEYDEAGQSDTIPSYQEAARAYGLAGLAFYEEAGTEYAQAALSEEAKKVSEQAFYEEQQSQNRYQPQKLEYSEQKAQSQDEEQQRKELRMQQETAQIKSVQEQLDKKLKEVEQQLKKVENSTKAKEDVGAFAEQVKRQLYEELHVEKLRRGLV